MPSPQANDTPWWFHPGSYMLLCFTPKRNHSIMTQCSVRGILAFRRGVEKKEPAVKQVNERLLRTLAPPQVDVILRQVDAAEMDEMWSFVGSKRQQRWLWHAIDHHTGQILAYMFGTREDETFLKLKELL